MAVVLLVTEQEVKDGTSIANNVDASKFCHWIEIAQDRYIKPAIGVTCYKEILDQFEASTLTADNLILLNGNDRDLKGIKKTLIWWVLWLAYADLHSTITPATVSVKSGDGFEAVTDQQLASRMTIAKDTASQYFDDLICFIRNNCDKYPCYASDPDCECTQRLDDGYSSTSGIALTNQDPSKRTEFLDDFDRLNPDLIP
jgi:hypothetical protein